MTDKFFCHTDTGIPDLKLAGDGILRLFKDSQAGVNKCRLKELCEISRDSLKRNVSMLDYYTARCVTC